MGGAGAGLEPPLRAAEVLRRVFRAPCVLHRLATSNYRRASGEHLFAMHGLPDLLRTEVLCAPKVRLG